VDSLVVVTHPQPLLLEARPITHPDTPPGSAALAYYLEDRLVARGVVAETAVPAIRSLLRAPVALALAATEDPEHNIEARVCLVLPVDAGELQRFMEEDEDEPEEPWKASVPPPSFELEPSFEEDEEEDDQARLALLPIGNVVRGAGDRHHEDVAADAREMLENLVAGRARGAVEKAIDDLLDSL
jgi:hypothetical protein